VLVRRYRITHSGGHFEDAVQQWPVVPEKGRPVDKAVASADTASLSYFFRNLLLLPRVEAGSDLDDDSRDQHGAGQTTETEVQREAAARVEELRLAMRSQPPQGNI
jgi:hypothetical protein